MRQGLINVIRFFTVSASNIDKLQRVQNNLARIVCCVKDQSVGASMLLHQLHWLPVERRVQFKLASLCYRILHTGQPNYLASTDIRPTTRNSNGGEQPGFFGRHCYFCMSVGCWPTSDNVEDSSSVLGVVENVCYPLKTREYMSEHTL